MTSAGTAKPPSPESRPSVPSAESTNVDRKNDSKWLLGVKNEIELTFLLQEIPRIVLILSDYPNYSEEDWETIQFQVFEIWPVHSRHIRFRTIMEDYYRDIYLPHIERNPRNTPAPKNFWPYSFQFYMCNPVRIFHCIVEDALRDPLINVREYVEPSVDRAAVAPLPMPLSVLRRSERTILRTALGTKAYELAVANGLDEEQRLLLALRDTSRATPHKASYRRGDR